MEYIREHTTIPTPSIIEVVNDNDDSWFSMTRVLGISLTDAWGTMTLASQERTRLELQGYLSQLRSLKSPTPPYIGSCSNGAAYDHRLNNGLPSGPFASLSEFHDILVAPVARCPRPELVGIFRRKLRDSHRIVFSHADLGSDHVFVEPETGQITGIIDWEMTGWWPEYWEYTKSLFGRRCVPWWGSLVSAVMEEYPSELSVERDLQDF